MKRLIGFLLTLLILGQAVLAETPEMPSGLELQLYSTTFESDWQATESAAPDTHKRLVISVTLTNWELATQSISENLQTELVYMNRYRFPATLEFSMEAIEPLVQLDGNLTFLLPNIVADDLGNAVLESRICNGFDTVLLTDIAALNGSAISLIGAGSSARHSAFGSYESSGFATAEDAALAYLRAMQAEDIASMISTFAIETYVDHFDVRTQLERVGSFSRTMYYALPADTTFARQTKITGRYNNISQLISSGYLLQIWPTEISEDFDMRIGLLEEGSTDTLIQAFNKNASSFQPNTIRFIEFVDPSAFPDAYDIYISEHNQKNIAIQAAICGCDEMKDLIMRFSMNGKEYYQFMQCSRYGDVWYNFSGTNHLTNIVGLSSNTNGLIPCEALS